jgi:hypothetical protein
VLADLESEELQPLASDFQAFIEALVDCGPFDEAQNRAMEDFRRRSAGG